MAKILIIADTFPPNRGGSEAYLYAIAKGLGCRGHEVSIFTPQAEGQSITQSSSEALNIRRSRFWKTLQDLGGHRNPLLNRISRLLILPLVAILVSGSDHDVVIAGHVLPAGLIALFLKRAGRCKKIIVTTYGEEIATYRHGARMRNLLQKVLKNADAITALTESGRTEIEEVLAGSGGRVTIVPPSVEMKSFAQDSPAPLLQGSPIILTLSRIVERKGFDTTVSAMVKVLPQLPDAHYYIAGVGPFEPTLRNLIKDLHLENNVTLLGAAENPEELFRQCDFFCMPNRTLQNGEKEGFGIVFLEAGQQGKPSIAGRSGGAIDAVLDGETGIVVAPDNPDETAEAILKLSMEPEYRKRLGQGAKCFAKTFTPARQVDSYEKIIESLLAE
jgi:phosphatidylinositol alpha-1,6-mannosyltransferase